jgi:hypothetical protein
MSSGGGTRPFCDQSRARLREQYAGQYVIIANGELAGVRGTYDEAISGAAELQTVLRHVLVFRADEDVPVADELLGGAGLREAPPQPPAAT